jgi:hypothetical protein
LVAPLVDCRHGDVVHKDAHALAARRPKCPVQRQGSRGFGQGGHHTGLGKRK